MQYKVIEIVNLLIDQNYEVRSQLKEQNPIVSYAFLKRADSIISSHDTLDIGNCIFHEKIYDNKY